MPSNLNPRGVESLMRAFGKKAEEKAAAKEAEVSLGERISDQLMSPEERRRKKKAKELADKYATEQE
jgi:hypothetical protein